MHHRFTPAVLLVLVASPVAAGELRIYPSDVYLAGSNRTQQFLLVEEENGRMVADHTAKAGFVTSRAGIARLEGDGVIRGLATGEAVVTARVNGRSAAAKVRVSVEDDGWSFRNHVIPTLTRNGCNSGACHGALAGKGGLKLSLRGYDPESDHFVLTRQALGRRVDLSRPADSLMLKKATRVVPHGGGTRFDEGSDHYALLRRWVEAGAAGPRDVDPGVQRLEIYPPALLMKPKDVARVVVVARYSNGVTEDVTRWSKFGSSEELVAGVNEDGQIKATGHGEAGITVNFGTKVGLVTVTSPYPSTFEAALFVNSPRNNFVDDLVLKKLELLRLPPSAQCTDEEFVRRVFLDTCGVLPKPEEVTAFLADRDSQKRAKLIDKLLDRPEFTDYWAYKWSDLLLVSSRKLPQPATWAFYRKVRQSVADNQGWDAFTRDVLTASGSNLTNGGGNYFVMHKDVSDLTETTAVTFLGTSITCCRCHNHPLEKWTQDEYWAFANLFSRVGLKNGDRPGEVLVQSRSDGDALHLRRGTAMSPAPLDGRPLPADSPLDRRKYLADWVTSPDNPYFAKALVNRVWKNFMGRGLVEAEDDLRETNPPSNKDLLDALAADFVKHKFDVKHLIRTVVNSAAYQRSSKPLAANASDDRFYSRYLIRRLPAEVILDAYSDVTGVPTPFNQMKSNAGDAVTPTTLYPTGTRAVQLPDSLAVSRFLEAFGRAERVQTCSCERTSDASVGQALHLNNGQTLNDKLRDKNSVVAKWLAENLTDAETVDRVFLTALSRPPTAEEKRKFLAILKESVKDGPQARREAVEDFVWAVLTGREFLFNH
jgi:hypothetical protein